MEPAVGTAPFSSYNMLELSPLDDSIFYVFLCNGVRFYVDVRSEKLEGEGGLLQEFNEFKEDIDDPDTMFNFEEWVLGALDAFILELAPNLAPGDRQPITLLEYFTPPTFAFELVNNGGKLCAVREDYDPKIHPDTSPRTQIVDDVQPGPGMEDNQPSAEMEDDEPAGRAVNLPTHPFSQTGGTIPRSAIPPVPLIPARQLERVGGLGDEERSNVPTKVRRVDTTNIFFFKAAFRDHGYRRDVQILSQVERSGKVGPPFRTSRLLGLVVWGEPGAGTDDDACLMGLLLEYIEGDTLADKMKEVPVATRRKWFRQVQATVARLHELGIVWGDVKPDNVMISAQGDAVVIDFGGGYTPEYIEPELQQTQRGDLMSVEHMADVMGVRYVA